MLVVCYGAPEDKGSGTSWTMMATEQSDLALAMAALRGISVVVAEEEVDAAPPHRAAQRLGEDGVVVEPERHRRRWKQAQPTQPR